MAPLRKRDFILTVQNDGKTPEAPSSGDVSPITQEPSQKAPRKSDPGSGVERMSVDEESSEDAETAHSDPKSTPLEHYDAKPWEGTVGLPSIQDYDLWNANAAQFIRSESGFEGEGSGWVGKRPLGEGGFGMAGLWEKYDHEGNVVDQMVVKQIGARKSGKWDANMPAEVRIMKLMNEVNCPSVVRIKAYRRYPLLRIHRIYMEFCPYGDLRKLYKRYRRFRRHLPEPFLWEVFYHMAKAVEAMAYGPKEGNPEGHAQWAFQIVHRDIKPGNIFLGKEDLDSLPYFPVPKLGDFGLAVTTYKGDPLNPGYYRDAGTPRYYAPEQFKFDKLPPLFQTNELSLAWWTNVWAIGATMFELLTLHPVHRYLLPGTGDEGVPEIQTGRKPEFSPNIRELVRECLRPLPIRRPTILALLGRINVCREGMRKYFEPIRGPDKSLPHEFERVFYRGNEIGTMPTGEWEPSRAAAAMDPSERESGFPDPSAGSLHFPEWPTFHPTQSEGLGTDRGGVQVGAEPRSVEWEDAEEDEDDDEDEDDENEDEDKDMEEDGKEGAEVQDNGLEPEDEDEDEDGDVVMGEDDDDEDEDEALAPKPLIYEAKGPINRFGRFRMI